MKRTNVLIYLKGSREPYFRVKINGAGFPYIVVDNNSIFLSKSDMKTIYGPYGEEQYVVDRIENKEELDTILSNPELTVDKLNIKQIARVST